MPYWKFQVTATAADVAATSTNRVFVLTSNAGNWPAGVWAHILDAGALDFRIYNAANTVEYDRVIYKYTASSYIEVYFVVPETTALSSFLVTVRVGGDTAANDNLPAKYLGYWPMADLVDISANANTMTNNGATFGAALIGDGIAVNGSTDIYTNTVSPYASFNAGTIGIAFKINSDRNVFEFILSCTRITGTNYSELNIYVTTQDVGVNDTLIFSSYKDGPFKWGILFPNNWIDTRLNQYQFLTITHDGTEITNISVNGINQSWSWSGATVDKTIWLDDLVNAVYPSNRISVGCIYEGSRLFGQVGNDDHLIFTTDQWTTYDSLMEYNCISSQSTFWTCGALTEEGAETEPSIDFIFPVLQRYYQENNQMRLNN